MSVGLTDHAVTLLHTPQVFETGSFSPCPSSSALLIVELVSSCRYKA